MNRDESFLRDTESLKYWLDTKIYCGKDLIKGGSWLAVNTKGWFVAITNIKTSNQVLQSPKDTSRGLIAFELLEQETFNPLAWKIIIESFDCRNFNVLFGDLNQECNSDDNFNLYIYSSTTSKLSSTKENKIFSISNGNSDSKWFKQERGEKLLKEITGDESFDEDILFSLLTDKIGSFDNDDFTTVPIFINPIKSRGTVSSSVILLNNDNEIEFIEKSWKENGELKFDKRFQFKLK